MHCCLGYKLSDPNLFQIFLNSFQFWDFEKKRKREEEEEKKHWQNVQRNSFVFQENGVKWIFYEFNSKWKQSVSSKKEKLFMCNVKQLSSFQAIHVTFAIWLMQARKLTKIYAYRMRGTFGIIIKKDFQERDGKEEKRKYMEWIYDFTKEALPSLLK